jgi:hypothetical protein
MYSLLINLLVINFCNFAILKEVGGIRSKQLLHDLKQKRCCNLKGEALDRSLPRTRFGRDYGPVARQTMIRSSVHFLV